ncbi:MAG: HEAT repeat domain-containing protein [Candidatus Bipolaricaulaceae bacterium]
MRRTLGVLAVVCLGLWGSAADPYVSGAVEELAALLGEGQAEVRRATVRALERLGSAAPDLVVAPLAAAMNDPDPEVRQAARRALYRVRPPRSPFEKAVAFLLSHKPWGVSSLESPHFRAILAPLRKEAGNAQLLAELIQTLYSGILEEERIVALHGLGTLAEVWEEALFALVRALTAEGCDLSCRYWIAQNLVRLGPSALPAARELLGALGELEPRLAALIRQALVGLGEAAVPKLVEELEAPWAAQRTAALEVLAELGEKAGSAVPAVVRLLEREGLGEVRRQALVALGRIGKGAPEALSALIRSVKSRDPDEVVAALEALGQLGPWAAEAQTEVARRTFHPWPEIRAAALRALGQLAPAEAALPHLIQALTDPCGTVRLAALSALGEIPEIERVREAVPQLVLLLRDSDPRVREGAAAVLGRVGPVPGEALGALVQLLEDPVWEVRRAAVRALGAWGPEAKAALPGVFLLLEREKDWKVKEAAEEAVGRMGLAGVLEFLSAIPEAEQASMVQAIGRLFERTLEAGLEELTHRITCPFVLFTKVLGIEEHLRVHIALKDGELVPELERLVAVGPVGRAAVQALTSLDDKVLQAFCAHVPGVLEDISRAPPLTRLMGLILALYCRIPPEDLRPLLEAVARDELWPLRFVAWVGLSHQALSPDPAVMEQGLRDPHPSVRGLSLMLKVRTAADPSERETLVLRALSDPARVVRWIAVFGLLSHSQSIPKEAVPHLLRLLDEEGQHLRELVGLALAHAKALEAAPRLLTWGAEAEFKGGRYWRILATFGEGILPLLREALSHPDPRFRETAIRAASLTPFFGKLSAEAAREVLNLFLLAFRDRDPRVRGTACSLGLAWSQLKEEFADVVLDTVIQSLAEEAVADVAGSTLLTLSLLDPEVLRKRAETLMPILRGLWERLPEDTRLYHVVPVWGRLGPAAAEATPLVLREWAALLKRKSPLDQRFEFTLCRETLQAFGKSAVPYLREALRDEALQEAAVEALEALGPAAREAVPDLLGLVKSAPDRIKVAIAQALADILGTQP